MAGKRNSLINTIKLRGLKKTLRKINKLGPTVQKLSDEDLQDKTQEFKNRLGAGESLDDIKVEAFAVFREACQRVLGMFPYDVQVLGGLAMHEGHIAEMKTGEGKTLTATLPLYLNALEGKGAILVTTNDYLVRRDAEEMGPVYEFMGLTVGIAAFPPGHNPSADEKRAIYAKDIVYSTSTRLGFDYLFDNLASNINAKFLRDFNYVIVDEADSVLLDNAQSPLVISGMPRVQSSLFDIAHQFAQVLEEGEDYKHSKKDGTVYLTPKGVSYAEEFFDIPNLYDARYFDLNKQINLALRAQCLYTRDEDYVVEDDKIILMGKGGGRLLRGNQMQGGIHQAIETKEGVQRTDTLLSMGSVTYQSFFNLFPKLAGMTGTGKSAEEEFIKTYHVSVIVIPTHEPVKRIDYPDQVYVTLTEKFLATLDYVKKCHAKGQPVLLISGTFEIVDIYSRMLLQEGIPHNVLTAKNEANEALIIKNAGQLGAVTVTTSMAGRGTDIKLGEGVAELGGLAVVGTERMQNSRIDDQLRGRAGRKGDPGLSQFFVSLEDSLLVKYGGARVKRFYEKNKEPNRENYGQALNSAYYARVIKKAQQKSEDGAEKGRQTTVRYDESIRVQRNKIYELRDNIIFDRVAIGEAVDTLVEDSIDSFLESKSQLKVSDLYRYILENFDYHHDKLADDFNLSDQKVTSYLWNLYQEELENKLYDLKSEEKMNEFLRLAVLRAVDNCWIEEVDNLQQLKNLVSMRQIAQRDGVSEYYRESLISYNKMVERVREATLRNIMLSTAKLDGNGHLSVYFM